MKKNQKKLQIEKNKIQKSTKNINKITKLRKFHIEKNTKKINKNQQKIQNKIFHFLLCIYFIHFSSFFIICLYY